MEFESSINLEKANEDFEIEVLASTLAHEIRNPLQAMRFQLDAALEGKATRDTFISLSKNLDRLERLVSRVQSLSKRHQLEAKHIHLGDLLTSVLSSVKFWLQASGIRISDHIFWEGEPVVEIDPELIEQVLLNLVINAIDAMPTGGDLGVSVNECENHFELEVADTGVGMEADVLSNIGTPFFTTKAKGTGLGLAFCKNVIALHRGQIEFESKLKQGTRVTIRLPKFQGK